MVPGVSVGLSEAAEHWAAFIQSLMMRGMNRPNCITSDDHKGIRKALAETLTGVPRQRCQFHFQQNAQAHVTSVRYRSIAAAHIRNVFNAGNRASAKLMIQNALSIFRADKQYKLADWFEENIEESLPSLIVLPRYSDVSEPPTSWKALTDNSNAEQTLSPSSPLKLLCSEL